jgi:nucleoside-diphosphate-sugar epimerase
MRIVGRGFIAQGMAYLTDRHPGTVVFASGVSSGQSSADEQFQREADLLFSELTRCKADSGRFVYFSSASPGMYAKGTCDGTEDGPVYPASAYCRHKLAMERIVLAAGVDYLIIRLTHTMGSRQRAHQLLPSLVRQIRSGCLTIHRGSHRDLIDVADAITIIGQLLDLDLRHEIVNVASGFSTPVERVIEHVERGLGTTADKHYVDVPEDTNVSVAKLMHLVPAAAALGFDARYFETVIDRHLKAVDETVCAQMDGSAEK